ncbi:hypothetical protein [Kribbella sp. NPDC049227]|uniref:hypothetical protein n=1 Tax=Kribbella sp. NPDC049227 TaxID=3364113 RepID=UPI00371367E9
MKRLGMIAAGLLVAYGIIRLIEGMDGSHGPGLGWTAGHLLFLAGMLVFAVVLVLARGELIRRRGVGTAAVVVGLLGVAAFVRVILVDLMVGFRAEDRAGMSRISDEYDRWPGNLDIYEPLSTVGPALFLVGLLALAVLLVLDRRLPVWSPILLAAGFAVITANLDLMPLGGLLLGAAFASAVRPAPTVDAVRTPDLGNRRDG